MSATSTIFSSTYIHYSLWFGSVSSPIQEHHQNLSLLAIAFITR